MRDLALLFGCFVKLGFFVVLQTPLENLKNFRCGFAGGTNDKGTVEALFVGAITFCESRFDILARSCNLTLLFSRPGRRSRWRRGWRRGVADSRMALKCFEPIGLREILPDFLTSSQEGGLSEDRPALRHREG